MTSTKIGINGHRRRSERTREALLAAGHKLLSERTMDSLAIDDIVQAAGVAKGSFYNHFDGKEALADTIREDIRQQIESTVEDVNKGVVDPAQRVARALSVYMSFILATRERALVTMRISAGLSSTLNPLNRGVLRDVADGLASGRFAAPTVEAGALFIIGVCQVSLMRAVEAAEREPVRVVSQDLCSMLLRGLGLAAVEAESISAEAIAALINLCEPEKIGEATEQTVAESDPGRPRTRPPGT